MKIRLLDLNGKSSEIDINTDLILPPLYSGFEVLSNSKNIYINNQPRNSTIINHNFSNYSIQTEDEDITIQFSLDGVPQTVINDYELFYRKFDGENTSNSNILEYLRGEVSVFNFTTDINSLLHNHVIEDINNKMKFLLNIFYRPRSQLKIISEIRPIDLVNSIGHESIKHLVSHSEHWKAKKGNGIIPSRILARTPEDDFGMYENRVSKILIDKLTYLVQNEERMRVNVKQQRDSRDEIFIQMDSNKKTYYHILISLLDKFFEDVPEKDLLDTIEKILSKLSRCKNTDLYRKLYQCEGVKEPLKVTNIFVMDENYKHVIQLWNLIKRVKTSIRQEKAIKLKRTFNQEYSLFCQVILFLSITYMGFTKNSSDESLFKKKRISDNQFEFKNWMLSLYIYELKTLDTDRIDIVLSRKQNYLFDLKAKNVFTHDLLARFNAISINNKLQFSKILTQEQIKSLCSHIPKKQTKHELIDQLSTFFRSQTHQEKRILLIPTSYKLPIPLNKKNNLYEEMFKILSDEIDIDQYDDIFFLSPYRIFDFYEDNESLSTFSEPFVLNYAYQKSSQYGILPISMYDLNSFRRLAKVFLKNMIYVDRSKCPLCGELLVHTDNQSLCRSCDYTIVEKICPYCKDQFLFTFIEPNKCPDNKNHNKYNDTVYNESKFKFLNITDFDKNNKPICPNCGKS